MTGIANYKSLLLDAAVVRDEVEDSKNTAYRIGKLFVDIISAVSSGAESTEGDITRITEAINKLRKDFEDANISGSEVIPESGGVRIRLKDALGNNIVEFSIPVATTSAAGLLSSGDKAKLDGVSTYGHRGLFNGNLDELHNITDIGTYSMLSAKATGLTSISGYLIVAYGTSGTCLYQFVFTDYREDKTGQVVGAFGRGNIFYRCYYLKGHGNVSAGTWTEWRNFTTGLFAGVDKLTSSDNTKLSFNDDDGREVQAIELLSATTSAAGLLSSGDKAKLDALTVNHSVFLISGTPNAVSYPNIDTKSGIFDFGEDPVLIIDGVEWTFKNIVDNSSYRNIPIIPDEGASSALVLLFSNDNERAFKFVQYISGELDGGVIIGTIRRNSSTGKILGVNFPFTVTIDGNMQGGGGSTDSADVSDLKNKVDTLWGIVHNGEVSSICVYIDLDKDGNQAIWEKISRQEALIYFVYQSEKIRGALVAPSGEDAYSITYVTDEGIRSTKIRKQTENGNVSYSRDDYYTVNVE